REEALKQEIVPRLKALASGEEELPESVTNLNKLAKHLAISRGKLTGYLDELLERDEKTAVMEVVRTNHLTVLTAESRGEITATLKALVDGSMALPEGVDSYRSLARHLGVNKYKIDKSATEDLTDEDREKLKTLLGTANKTRSLEDARVALAPAVERIRRFIAGEEEIPNRLHTQPRLAKALGISAYDLSVVLDKIIESDERKQLMDKLNENRWARLAKRKAAEYQDIIEPLEAIGRGERSFPAEIATVADLGQHLEADEKRFQTAWNNHFDKDLRTKVAELLDTNRRARDEADLQEKYQPVLEKLTRYATGEEEIPLAITTVEELAATFELHEVVLKRIYGAHLDDNLQRTFIEKLEVNRRAREIAQYREQHSSVFEGIENIVEGRVPPPVADSYGKLAIYLGTTESKLRTVLDKFDEEVEDRLCKLVGLQDIERLRTDRQGVVREVAAHIRAEFDAYRQDESARLEPSHELGKRFGLTLGEISIALREGLTRDERKEREARIKDQGKEQRKDERQAKNIVNCREYVNAQVLQFLRGKEDSLLGNSALAVRYGLTDEDVDGIISSLQPWRREMRQKVLSAFTDLQRKRAIREEYKEHLKR
ncbi:MAG: hypothetical protein KDD70_17090, partial [Bdellovibrionales bacterium]|nr:hypothetical protein [Bdellovibrionales bacterium]